MEPKDTSKKHFYISMVKSIVRGSVGAALAMNNFVAAGLLLIAAEILGVWEEL